jgi:hypothetical protein
VVRGANGRDFDISERPGIDDREGQGRETVAGIVIPKSRRGFFCRDFQRQASPHAPLFMRGNGKAWDK